MTLAPDPATEGVAAVETAIPLRWRDLDPYGHVNNAVYATFFEQARDVAMTTVLRGVTAEPNYVLARLTIDFRREIRPADGPVAVACRFVAVGTASLETRETIRTAAGELAAEAAAVVVKFDRATRRSMPWTAAERRAFGEAGAVSRSR